MSLVARALASRLSTKIILPYLVLALCLAVTMTLVTVRFTAGALQERVDNRLIEAAQVTSDGLVAVEDDQLVQLRQMVFTEGVAEALADHDPRELAALLRPQWTNAGLSTLIAFDRTGQPLLGWQREPGTTPSAPPVNVVVDDLSSWWLVQQIVANRTDAFGDKYSGFKERQFFTVAPVRQAGKVVGGLMVAMPVEQLLERLQSSSQASVTTFYDERGLAVATTQVLVNHQTVPPIPADALSQLLDARDRSTKLHVQSVVSLNGREYQFAYSPLQIRRTMSGFYSVGLSRQFIADSWAKQRLPLVVLALLLLTAVVAVGVVVSRGITLSLNNLVNTARAVARGELDQRSAVRSSDELGVLATSFNDMTERLLHLYTTSRELSAQTESSAILSQTAAALRRLMPIDDVLLLLNDGGRWRSYLAEGSSPALLSLHHKTLVDGRLSEALAEQSQTPLILPTLDPLLRQLPELQAYPQVCSIALQVQGQRVGVLLLCQAERASLSAALVPPVTAITSMAATALHNTRLYQKVQEEGIRRQVILESIADAVVVCDAERHVVLMNGAAEMLLDVHDWAGDGRHFDELPLRQLDVPRTLLSRNRQRLVRYEARGRILSAHSARWSAAGPEASGEVIILHDISAEVALDRAKTDLIAMISHELRTPLTGILGAIDLLAKGYGGQLSPLQGELADAALRQSRLMSNLIDKAVMVANIETGQLNFTVQPTWVNDVIEAATSALGRSLPEGVELDVDVAADLPPAFVDPQKLRIVLEQLLDNAIKYGEGAAIQVIAQRRGGSVALGVRDHGPGMSSEDVQNLFRRLSRSADSSSKAQRGLGLGLVIVQALIERQGGTIEVESRPGKGSIFWVIVPGAGDGASSLVA